MQMDRIRYAKQLRAKDCAITAYVNSIKWTGINLNYSKCYNDFAKAFNLSTDGVKINYFESQIKKTQFYSIKNIADRTCYKDMLDHLDTGGAIIFTYKEPNGNGGYHTVFIPRGNNKYLYFVNRSKKLCSTISPVDKHEVFDMLLDYNQAIFISKNT